MGNKFLKRLFRRERKGNTATIDDPGSSSIGSLNVSSPQIVSAQGLPSQQSSSDSIPKQAYEAVSSGQPASAFEDSQRFPDHTGVHTIRPTNISGNNNQAADDIEGTSMEVDRLLTLLMQNAELLEFSLSKLPESERWVLLNGIGVRFLERFLQTGSIDDVDRAIAIEERAIESASVDHSDRAMCLSNLGVALEMRFKRIGSLDNLDRAIVTNTQAVELTPVNHPNRAGRLNNLGNALQSRFERMGSMDDLDRAIMTKEQAIELTPVNHPNRAMYLNNLGTALRSRFVRTGSIDDLDRAVVTKEQAVKLTPVNHPNRATVLNNLGIALHSRFKRIGLMDDLDRAIITTNQAVESAPVNHPDRAGWLNNLGITLQSRFERTGSMDDLDRAIVAKGQAVESTPVDHPNRAVTLNSLGIALRSRFERTGSIDDLGRAIAANEQAVESTPVNHPKHAIYLSNLGIALRSRFRWTGSMDDLDRAIVTYEQAVEFIPVDHPDRATMLNNFGNALWSRFERTGSMDDLNLAIITNERAVESTPIDRPNRAMYLSNFAITLQRRFERTGLMEDLDRAIMANEQAVEATPVDHPQRGARLSNLGIALQSKFEWTGSMNDLDRAILSMEQAVQSTPVDHPKRAVYLNNLGSALQSRFDRTGSMEDLDRGMAANEQAVKSTPVDHPNRAGRLDNLGYAFQSRFERTGSTDDFDRAIMTKDQAAKSDTASPSIRLKAAESCSDLLISQRRYSHARLILQAAVQLLSRVSPRQLKRSDQQFNISRFANITSRAVSLSLANADESYKSLQLQELGRGIIANMQLEIRSDISVLASSHPDLAQQFQELRDQIDSPTTSGHSMIEDYSASINSISTPDPSKSISERRALLKRFDDLLQHIRSLQGFENFLQGPSELELRSLAEDGAIVVFNVSDIRSDAFLVTADEIRSVPLPLLTSDSVEDLVKRFLDAINEQDPNRYRHAMRQMNGVLEGLWDFAVKPVLDELGFTQMPLPGEIWPRVWWVGSGLLSILPIHASGYHDSDPSQTALDRVISSYAPTIKSLAYARERAAGADPSIKEKAIVVGMSTTPEQKSLPFVETEVKELENLFSNASIYTRVMRNPTRMEALSELPQYTIVHFACHGYSADDPSQSSLLLEDWKIAPLTVSDLTSLNIRSAKFAYLSACHTSAMQNFRLLDESISLSSAIQLSGYSSVVGSLWQVMDSHSVEVARDIYKWILREGELDFRRSAEGLHRAVRDLRDRKRFKTKTDPLVWASFIHVGI
jgi:tetratricopeptide (TPR) repeat protein